MPSALCAVPATSRRSAVGFSISASGSGTTHNEFYNNILFSQGWGSNYRGGLGVQNLIVEGGAEIFSSFAKKETRLL